MDDGPFDPDDLQVLSPHFDSAPEEPKVVVEILDWTFGDRDNQGSYMLSARCTNCGTLANILLIKQHEHPGYGAGPDCSYCGCVKWSGWGAASG